MNLLWDEVKHTCGAMAPWIALVALAMFMFQQQDRLLNERLNAIGSALDTQNAVLSDLRDVVSQSGLVVPPFRPPIGTEND